MLIPLRKLLKRYVFRLFLRTEFTANNIIIIILGSKISGKMLKRFAVKMLNIFAEKCSGRKIPNIIADKIGATEIS